MAAERAEGSQVGCKAAIRMLQRRYKNGTKETIARDEYKPLDFDKHAEYALVATESFREDGSSKGHVLKVNSPQLLAVFRNVVGSHPSVPANFDRPFTVPRPLTVLIHHWDNLEQHRATLDDTDDAAAHLDLLVDFMRRELGQQRQRCLDFAAKRCVSFDDLWMIYRPDDVMAAPERGHDWLLKLENTAYIDDSCSGRRFEVHCAHPFLDGSKLVRRRKTFAIYERAHVPGKTLVAVDTLPVFPRAFLAAGPELEDRLDARGARYADLTGTPCLYHDGLAEYCKSPPSSFFHWELGSFDTVWLPKTETARVVVDPKTFLEDFAKEAETIHGDFPDDFRAWAARRFGTLERALRVLAAPFTYGYSLQGKLWCKYYVDNLSPVAWKASAIDSLILPRSEKTLLSALVRSHQFPADARDVAAQKGKGLVVLLHGTPGSGKTLTAEVSAELARAPLMPISLRELYEYKYFDELKLKAFLTYATQWRAVVLIDEADVFLESRGSGESTSADRNALVAVFLRYLEYFSGIIFLTSNRVEDFDLAVKSRIHLALQYDPPALQLRKRIWTSRLASLRDDVDMDVDAVIADLVAHEMNGREISNTINTASTLARSEGLKLQIGHLETVIGVWEGFNRNLASLQAEKEARTMHKADGTIVEAAKTANGTEVQVNGMSNGHSA